MSKQPTPRLDAIRRLVESSKDSFDRVGTLRVDKDSATIWLDGTIDQSYFGGADAPQIMDALSPFRGRRVTLKINSPGGDVDTGIAIYNLLREHPGGVDTFATSMVASMGSYVFQAGKRRIMAENAAMMLHPPWSYVVGDAEQMERRAEILRLYAERLVPGYARASGQSEDTIRKMLTSGESWFSAAEAVAEGFADEVAGRKVFPKSAAAKARAGVIAADAILATTSPEMPEPKADPFPKRTAAKLASLKAYSQSLEC